MIMIMIMIIFVDLIATEVEKDFKCVLFHPF